MSGKLQPISNSEWPWTVKVDARTYWNDTAIDLDANAPYWFEVKDGQYWLDWFVRSGPEGYSTWSLAPAGWLRRVRSAKWFALIGSIDRRPERTFVIGSNCLYTPPERGRLYCFANDVPCMYWNNRGTIELTVSRSS